ncbi:hypothetical protein DFR70_106253 [Nocardia tenerifensis]|uniref:Uncharacterized protein n=1 Tax=Nocardia tenerifensis TaxID=228006 RepID=A0A318KMF3_9NOCA|nr:hypothetical protein DFR70_106253 [Nocardia tenerifensis]
MTQSSPLHTPVIVKPEDAADYLGKMGIAIPIIDLALNAGEVTAGNITRHHPVTAAGLTRWIHIVGTLREALADTAEWIGDDPQNRPISKRIDRRYTLSTVCGTEPTGVIDHPSGPMAARRRGPATAEAVNGIEPLITVEKLRGIATAHDVEPPPGNWFLVYHRAEDLVRREVSLPLGFDRNAGQFTGWKVRVILDSWKPEGVTRRPIDVGGEDVDFRVTEVG